MKLAEVKEKLTNSGLKATHQRMVLFQAFSMYEGHPTAEIIYDKVSFKNPSLSLSTVYRILEDFENSGLINKVATKGGVHRYDANLEPHNHIICTKTKDIYDFSDLELNDLITKFFKEKSIENFKITDIKIQVNGEKVDPDKKVFLNKN